jgi:hypothetical protein
MIGTVVGEASGADYSALGPTTNFFYLRLALTGPKPYDVLLPFREVIRRALNGTVTLLELGLVPKPHFHYNKIVTELKQSITGPGPGARALEQVCWAHYTRMVSKTIVLKL